MAKHRGRKRKTNVKRTASGRIAQPAKQTPWTPELVAQRERLAGKGNGLDQKAGHALGQTYESGLLGEKGSDVATQRYAAGEAYRNLHRKWASMAGVRPRELTMHGATSGREVDADVWHRVKNDKDAADAALKQKGILPFTAMDSLLCDNVLTWAMRDRNQKAHKAMIAGLDVLVLHFRLGGMARAV